MDAIFLGHQTWLISKGATHILIDPLLMEVFGSADGSFSAAYPYREINWNKLPKITSVFLSHEHPDHVCMDTLLKLDPDTPIFVSPLMLAPMVSMFKKMGLNIKEFREQEPVHFKDFSITPYHGSSSTLFWENRVYQFHIQDDDHGLFLAVDAGMSDIFAKLVKERKCRQPDMFVVSNNAQVKNLFRRTAFENANISPQLNGQKNGAVQLDVFWGLHCQYLGEFEKPPRVVVNGGGFLKGAQDHELAEEDYFGRIVNDINLRFPELGFCAPVSGDVISFSEGSFSVRRNLELVRSYNFNEFHKRHPEVVPSKNHNQAPFFPYLKTSTEIDLDFAQKHIVAELTTALEYYRINSLRHLLFDKIKTENLSSKISFRFLLSSQQTPVFEFTFDLFEQSPVEIGFHNADLSLTFFLVDFMAVISGEIEFWDLSGPHIEARAYDMPEHPFIAFLYVNFGEFVRQDLVQKRMDRRILSRNSRNKYMGV